ncbi:MAG: acyl-CoA thioesterase [Phycisphaerales bacterium]
MRSHTTTIRVRYAECDPMNVAHHSAYLPWFEMGRTELLRSDGVSYASLEREGGVRLAVVSIEVKYKRPARYDELLELTTRLVETSRVKIIHEYELKREYEILATAKTTLACLDTEGKLQPLPEILERHAAGTVGGAR